MCADWGTGSMGEIVVLPEFFFPQRRRDAEISAEKARTVWSLVFSALSSASLRLCGEGHSLFGSDFARPGAWGRALLIGMMLVTLGAQGDGERQLETAVYRETVMGDVAAAIGMYRAILAQRSEEHTSELQSPCNLVCR